MKKSGFLAVSPWPYNSQGLFLLKRENDTWVSKGSSEDIVGPTAMTFMNSILAQGFETASLTSDEYFMGSTRVQTTGIPTPVPAPVLQEWSSIRENNKPFLKRVSNDEIVVSNYQVGGNVYTFSNGGTLSNVEPVRLTPIGVQMAYYTHGMYSLLNLPQWRNAVQVDQNTALYGSIGFSRRPSTMTDDRTVYDNGFTPFDKDYCLPFLEVDSNLVTTVASTANTASVDILTAAAELPETLRSIMNACIKVVKLYTDSRKGALRLQNKAKRVRMSYDEAVAKFDSIIQTITDGPGSNRFKRKRIREIAKNREQLKKQLNHNLEEIADAIASVWLNFRYNIMPNVYLIEGALEAIDKADKVYARWAKTLVSSIPIPDGYSGNIKVTHRCQIKRLFKGLSINNRLSSNPLITAWELIPLSFVIDWFINIGDTIASLTTVPSNVAQEGSTYSWKVEGYISKTYIDGSTVNVKISGYKRIVIIPSLYCRLSWNPDLSPVRQLDALALTWNLALKRLLKLKD